MTYGAAALPLASFAPATAGARWGAASRPGYWETTSRVLSPMHSIDTERRCVSQDQVRKFMSCYINHHYDCVCAEDVVGDGHVAFKGHAPNAKTDPRSGSPAPGPIPTPS